MFNKPSRIVVWQCKKCKRVWANSMFEGDKNPKCPDCKNDSIYVVAI